MRILQLLLVLVLFAPAAHAQTAPHLDGRIETDPAAGWVRGDVCLMQLPPQRTYAFLLHRGLNIREVRDAASGRSLDFGGAYDATSVGDATRYAVEDSVGTEGFCVSYVGAFPVYRVDDGERGAHDWKGRIAFDGRTVRATEQTRFYPVVEDSTTGAYLEAVSYRIDVSCAECPALYVNGSAPAAGPLATFTSEEARPLFLYAGTFPFTPADGVHFVGAEITAADAVLIREGVRELAEAHERYLGVRYADEPAFLSFASVSRDRTLGRSTWAFVTWPTVAMDGRVPFAALIDSTSGRRAFAPSMVDWMSHEMAHYFFGTRYAPRGPLTWFLLESTAEFMSLKAIRALRGEAAYAARLRDHYRSAVAAGPVVPLDSVREARWIGGNYRYRLGPLLLVALEEYAGEDVLRRALAGLVTDPPTAEVDYAAWRARLLASGAAERALSRFEEECLHRPVDEGCLTAFSGTDAGEAPR